MVSRSALVPPLALLVLACTPPKPGGLDEAGATSGTDETSETDEAGETTEAGTGESDESGVTSDPEDLPDAGQPCELFSQDCPAGQKCVPYQSQGAVFDEYRCVWVTGEGQTGDACNFGGGEQDYDDCDANTHCWGAQLIDGEPIGECTPFCTGTPSRPSCPGDYSCQVSSSAAICIQTCDPLAQDCDPGEGCYWGTSAFQCVPTTEDIPTGEPCGFLNDCVAGDICVNQQGLSGCAGDFCCTSYCALDEGDGPCQDIDPAYVCTPFWSEGEAPAGEENIGVCVLPP